MFGLTVGDALGAHVEFRPNSYLVAHPVKDLVGGGTWGLERGQFTDDTSMALCLANSLIACGDFIPYDQLVRYKWWFRQGYMSSTGHCFDIGAATRQSIQEFEERQRKFAHDHNIPLDEIDSLSDDELLQAFDVNCSKDNVAGNGALMRLAPVPLFFYRHPKVAVEYSGISGKITHGDVKAYDACRYYGALIVAALNGAKKSELTSKTFYDEHREWFDNQALHPEIMAIAGGSYQKPGGYKDGIRGKGYIVNALEAALWAFWSDGDSFEIGVLNAVNLGDDTDTTAAIYGQLAGVHYGYKKLPEKWLKYIYAKDFLRCVSSWIAHDGEQWSRNQGIPDSNELTNSSNFVLFNSNSDVSSFSTQHSYESFKPSVDPDMISSTILRKAIDPSGRIGHLYDACQDHILPSPHITLDIKEDYSNPFIKCIGFALMYLPAIVSVGLYFEQKRAFAMGIAVCGSGVVESILPDVTIEKSPVKSFLNQIIEQIDIKLLKNAAFTLFAISNFLTSLGFNAVYNYADDLANDSKVIKDQRTYIVMAIGLSNIFGRLIIGYLGDRKWVNRLFFFILTVIISGVATIMAPLCGSSVIPHIGYASFFGFFSGGYVTLTAIVLVDIVGINKLSDAFGVLLLFIGVATAIGTPVVGAMRDTFSHFARPFLWPYIICGGCTVLSGVILFAIPFLQRKKLNDNQIETDVDTIHFEKDLLSQEQQQKI
ncbi:unnamed protein product [Rotaria sp. Silwood2]|nr:unnamed protein product [Rotaria sp. Silwood2]